MAGRVEGFGLVPLFTTWDSVAGLGRAPIPENISGRKLTQVLNSVISVLVHQRTGDVCDLDNSGVWDGDYGWGVRVRRPFGARGMSSIRYGIRLGDLKNKQPTHTRNTHTENTHTVGSTVCVFQRILHAFLKIAGREPCDLAGEQWGRCTRGKAGAEDASRRPPSHAVSGTGNNPLQHRLAIVLLISYAHGYDVRARCRCEPKRVGAQSDLTPSPFAGGNIHHSSCRNQGGCAPVRPWVMALIF